MKNLAEIAADFTALVAAGQPQIAADKYWADDVAISEPSGPSTRATCTVQGVAAARESLARWMSDNAVENVAVDGPFITGNDFALFIDFEIIRRATGKREPFSEIAVYTVRDGKISKERHFHE